MDKKKTVLLISLGLTFSLAIAGVVIVDAISNKQTTPTRKSPYQLYCESHPDYHRTEEEWLQDLINGKLGDKSKYEVSFNSNGGSSVEKQIVLENEYVVKPDDPTRLGYTFRDWTYNGTPWLFDIYTVSKNINLSANWNINHYSITYDMDGGSIETDNPLTYTVESAFEFNSPSKLGYEFLGWYDTDNVKINSIVKGMTGNLSLKAKWTANQNALSVSSTDLDKGSAQVVSGDGYTDETITVKASSNSPFVFKGWFNESGLVSKENPYSFIMPAEDVYLEAAFDELRHLELTVSDPSKGITIGTGDYVIGDEVSIECQVTDGIFKGWYNSNNELVSSFAQYTFNMYDEDYSLTAMFVDDSEEEEYRYKIEHGIIPSFSEDMKTTTYGMYPKTVVEDIELITKLNQLDDPDEYGYYELDGDYYIKKMVSVYNFADYFGPDVPVEKKYDSGSEMVSGTMAWFKAEPILWDVIASENSKYTLMSHNLIEKSSYSITEYDRTIEGKTVHSSNYEYSLVREWLNSSLYEKLFVLSDEFVAYSEIESEGTEKLMEKLYIPSLAEINELSNELKAPKTTDYIRSSGVLYNFDNYYYCSDYWSRTPDGALHNHVKRLLPGGGNGRSGSNQSQCIRPCLTIEYK